MGTIDEAPVVELRDAFDDNYFVGPPPNSSSQDDSSEGRSSSNKGPVTRNRRDQQSAPINLGPVWGASVSDSNQQDGQPSEGTNSLTDPVDYTPSHPSLMPRSTPRHRGTPNRRGGIRRTHHTMISDNNNMTPRPPEPPIDPPRLRPALLNEMPSRTYRRSLNVRQPMTSQVAILRPPIVPQPRMQQPNPIDLPSTASNLTWNPATAPPKFAGAPNFTTFGNGRPETQNLSDWNPPLRPNLDHQSYQRPQAPIAHAQQTQSSITTAAHLLRHPSQPNMIPAHAPTNPAPRPRQHVPNFIPQAVPVRPAYVDFFRQISNIIPGVDLNSLLRQLDPANSNQTVRIPVPNNSNTTALQASIVNLRDMMIQNMQNNGNFQQQTQPQFQQNVINSTIVNNFLVQQNAQMPHQQPPPPPSEDDMAKQDVDAGANQDEEYHEVETYADYAPAKLTLGRPHPDPVVETSSLSTVEPPDVTYELKLPSKVIDNAMLSALQLESVIYACQQHAQFLPDNQFRRGFLIGDGAGVGKGRTIAGIIYENFLCGRKKSIWFSVSTDLKLDAERDLRDIGAKIPVHLLGKFPYGRKIHEPYGVLFTTYSGLVSKSQSVRGTLGSRLGQLVTWAGANFDGVIVFDECHKAKNISVSGKQKPSKAAEMALEIQQRLPNARVVYASATGASETRHLGYMTRLGIWGKGTPYGTFASFREAIERRGVGAMELVAVDLKMRGSYIARQLSFKTTSFEIRTAHLDPSFVEVYDECVEMWSKALKSFTEAANYMYTDRKRLRTIWTSFWAAHQKFFKYLCIGAKVPLVVQIAKEALESGKCVVIGLQSTGESKTLEALEDGEINEFVSTARATFESLVENHFPAPWKPKTARLQPAVSTSAQSSSISSPLVRPGEESGSQSSGSSSTTVDESWIRNDNLIKFVVEDGIVKPQVDEEMARKLRSSNSKKRKTKDTPRLDPIKTRNQKVLKELVAAKKAQDKKKSSRALRAARRESDRRGGRSRIKRVEDDSSDTEISNPLSSCSSENFLTSTSGDTNRETDDDTYDEESEDDDDDYSDTITENDEDSDDDLSIVETRYAHATTKKQMIESDSDSDIQITAVKPKKNYEVIILGDDEDEEDDDNPENPLIKHGAKLTELKEELLAIIEKLGPKLPNNTLDDLIDRLGGPEKVAEMTGRKGRVVKDEDGQISYRQRNESDALDDMNIAEKERFMKGKKLVAIISEAASSGISLQADKRVPNKRRRVHITIELPWSADRAIQQFGRTHRSNQTSGPEYVFVISELSGERRFASTVAKRLESLGALTHGDRRATTDSRDLSQFNIASRYCKQALDLVCKLLERGIRFADIHPDYPEKDFIRDARQAYVDAGLGCFVTGDLFRPDNNAVQINHFLNRLLGMKVKIQNAIFKLFTDYTDRLITRKKVAGLYDAGILELNSESGKTRCEEPEDFYLRTKFGIVKCTLHNVQVERGISWDEVLGMLREREGQDTRAGFYATTNPLTKAKLVFLILREPQTVDLFRVYKPNTGRQAKPEYFSIISDRASKVSQDEAQRIWTRVYESTSSNCVHQCYFNSCKRKEAKLKCDVGLRHRYYCILSGGILTAWPYLEKKMPDATSKLQIVRLRLDMNNRVIGPIIAQDHLDRVRKILREGEDKGVEF